MKKLYLLSILVLLSIALIYSCSSEEEDTIAPVVQTPQPEPEPEAPAPTQYTLTVTAGEGGSVSTGGGTYEEGTEVTITATANEGYRFTGWEGNNSTNESLTISLNSNQTFQALFELIPLDTDGDGVIDSEDYLPLNPTLTYDDWGEFKDEYAEVFFSSDISDLNVQGMTNDLEMFQDYFGKTGGAFWVIGKDIEAALELADIWCQKRIERGELFYFSEFGSIEILHSICMSEMINPHASKDWVNGENSNGQYYTGYISDDYIGIFERYRRQAVLRNEGGGLIADRNQNRRGAYLVAPNNYDPNTFKNFSPPWASTSNLLIEFLPMIHSFYNDSRETFTDITGNTKRLGGGPDWIPGGRFFYVNYIIRKLYNDGLYNTLINPDNVRDEGLKNYMRGLMNEAQEEYKECPNFRLEDLLSSGNCTYYKLGAWAQAYLANKVGNIDVFVKVLWPKMNELGFENAFIDTFGLNFDELDIEFKNFLNLSIDEQLEIIPDIKFNLP